MVKSKVKLIGIDVQTLAGPLSGISRYTINLIEILAKKNNFKWILYANKPLSYDCSHLKNVELKIDNTFSFLPYVLWLQLVLPFYIFRDRVNLFWAPSHRASFLGMIIAPTIVTIHDMVYFKHGYTMPFLSRILDFISIPLAAKFSRKIITVSKSNKSDLKNYLGIPTEKIVVTHLASANFNESPQTYSGDHDNFILFVGTFEPRKNIEKLIKAFSLLNFSSYKNIKLVIVGRYGWGGVNPKALAIKYNLRDMVEVVTSATDKTLYYYYSRCTFLAMPSLWEGFGLPIVEALSFGKPVLTSNIASMPEVAGNAGIYIDPNDVKDIKNGIDLILQKNCYEALTKNAAKQSAKFNWIKTAFDTESIFTNEISKQ